MVHLLSSLAHLPDFWVIEASFSYWDSSLTLGFPKGLHGAWAGFANIFLEE